MSAKKRGARRKVEKDPSQTVLSFSKNKMKYERRSADPSPNKSPKKKPRKTKNPLPTPVSTHVIPETPETDVSSSIATPLPQTKQEPSNSASSSETEYFTPSEDVSMKNGGQMLFMSKLQQSVSDKSTDQSFDLEESSEILAQKPEGVSNDDPLVISSDDSVICIDDDDDEPPVRSSKLMEFQRRIIDSTPPKRKKRPVEGGDTSSPKRQNTKKEVAVKKEAAVKQEPVKPKIKKEHATSTPLQPALVRKTPRRKRVSPKITNSVIVIPETPFDSPVSEKKKKHIEQYFSSSPTVADSPLSSAQDIASDGVFSSPLQVQESLQRTTMSSMSLSPAQDIASDGIFSSPTRRPRTRAATKSFADTKSSPDSVKSPGDDGFDSDSDCPGSNSYYDGIDEDSESDAELKVSYDNLDVQQKAKDRLAEIMEKVKQSTSASGTPRGGSNEPEDDVAVKYQVAQKKAAERDMQREEKKEAYKRKIQEEKEAKRNQELTDAPLLECESAGIEIFSYDTKKIAFKPRHKLLKLLAKPKLGMKPSQVLPRKAVDLKFADVDVEWLLVKLARETLSSERRFIVANLALSDVRLDETHLEKTMKAVGLRYWDKRKGSHQDRSSAYSVLNKSRRSESMPCTPVKAKRACRTNLFTPVKSIQEEPFSPFASFDSPISLSMESPSKVAKAPSPPPPMRYHNSESLSDFFDTAALLIEPGSVEFLFRLLLLVSSDSSLDSLQSDTSPAYAGMARLLARDDFDAVRALDIARDALDLKSARSRALKALYCGSDRYMAEFAHTCASVFFLEEYISDKSTSELISLCAEDKNIVTSTFLEHLKDFTLASEKSSPFIRHVFCFFAQAMDPATAKPWTPEQIREVEMTIKSRSDFVNNLDDFKFNALAMSWLTRVCNEFAVLSENDLTKMVL
ncbi:hypothetical protein CJU89_1633 [Yarrowia sp. B02]|nr:hypothetical protein CJU89_1633 [Yarrowia sp. B02]